MKKIYRHITLATTILLAVSASAETVSQRQAKRIATQFFNAAYGQVMAEPAFVYNGKRLTTERLFSPFYVYNHPAGGFVVISAENKAFPILGYSLTENFDPSNIGEETTELLRLYASHIENIRYDSSIPEQAIAAWGDIPEYINGILTAEYDATDPSLSRDEAMTELAWTATSPDAEASASGFYSPDQWEDMVGAELAAKRSVPLGLITEDAIYPVILHGRKGDYYRMRLDGPNRQLWRLLPTEIISIGEMAVFGNPPKMPEIEVEDFPFEFYDSFMAANKAEYEADRASIEDALVIREPYVKWNGLGHYTVTLPENVSSVRVYALDGSQVFAEKFRDTNVANLYLSKLPTGFYFAVFLGESGMPYDIKLFR